MAYQIGHVVLGKVVKVSGAMFALRQRSTEKKARRIELHDVPWSRFAGHEFLIQDFNDKGKKHRIQVLYKRIALLIRTVHVQHACDALTFYVLSVHHETLLQI